MTGRKPKWRARRSRAAALVGHRMNEAVARSDQRSRDRERLPMIEPTRRIGLAFVLIQIFVAGLASPALACACCTNQGQRNVATVDAGFRQTAGNREPALRRQGDAFHRRRRCRRHRRHRHARRDLHAHRQMAGRPAGAFVPRRGRPHRHLVAGAPRHGIGVRGRPARPPRQRPGTQALQGMEAFGARRGQAAYSSRVSHRGKSSR